VIVVKGGERSVAARPSHFGEMPNRTFGNRQNRPSHWLAPSAFRALCGHSVSLQEDGRPPSRSRARGPILPFIQDAFAAVQPHQTGHSLMAQHFRAVEAVSAGQAADIEPP